MPSTIDILPLTKFLIDIDFEVALNESLKF